MRELCAAAAETVDLAERMDRAQLAWAVEGTPVEWRPCAVDDGCPQDSG